MGEAEIAVPKDRNASLNPMLVPKRRNIIYGLGNIMISFYAIGMTNLDPEEQLQELYYFEVSTATISGITHRVSSEL